MHETDLSSFYVVFYGVCTTDEFIEESHLFSKDVDSLYNQSAKLKAKNDSLTSTTTLKSVLRTN